MLVWLLGKKKEPPPQEATLPVGLIVRYNGMRVRILRVKKEDLLPGRRGQIRYDIKYLPWQGWGYGWFFQDQIRHQVEFIEDEDHGD